MNFSALTIVDAWGFNASASGKSDKMRIGQLSFDEIQCNKIEHKVCVTVQMLNRMSSPDIESEIALVAVHKAKVLAQLENITLGSYTSTTKNDGKHIVVIQCGDEEDVNVTFEKLDKVLASFNNPNYEVYVDEW